MNDPDNKVYSSMMLDKDVLKGMTQGKSWAVMKTDADFMGSKIAGAESINDIVKSMFSEELLKAGFNAMASVASGEVSGTFNFLGLFEVEAAAKGYAFGAGIEGSTGFDSKTGEVKASFRASLGLGGGLSFSAKPKGVFADFLGLSGNSDKYSSSASINTDIGRQYSKTSTTTVDVSKTRGGSTKQVDTTIKTATTNSGKKPQQVHHFKVQTTKVRHILEQEVVLVLRTER